MLECDVDLERDSPKSHFIVVCFLVIVSTLLILAGLKHFGFDLSATFNRSGAKGVVTVRFFLFSPFSLTATERKTKTDFACFFTSVSIFLTGVCSIYQLGSTEKTDRSTSIQ